MSKLVTPYVSHRTAPCAVRFTRDDSLPGTTCRRYLMAYPQALFRGSGLWLWGADETTLIHNIKVGNALCFTLDHTGIPGLYFEAGLSFEAFERLLEQGRDESCPWTHEYLQRLPEPACHQHIRTPTLEIGNSLGLDIEGPLTHAVMWGQSVL